MEFDPVLVHEWLRRTARRVPEKEAILFGQERWTYQRLDDDSDRVAEALIGLGIGCQDRVVILLGNQPETVVSLYAVLKAGGVFLILDGNTRARRLKYVLENSGATALICRANQAGVVAEAIEGCRSDLRIIRFGERSAQCPSVSGVSWDSILGPWGTGPGSHAICGRRPRSIDIDLAALIYTSGTTGDPKGVMCTHWNVISAAKSIMQYLDSEEHDVILNVLPLSFSYGLYQVLASCMFGGTVILERSFLYPHVVLRRIAEEKVTGFPLVPSMVAMLLRMETIEQHDFSTLRYITSAGAALPVGHLTRLRRLVPKAKILNMYGLTECVRVCYLTGEELDRRPTSVGKAMPNCEVAIVDADGNAVAPGEIGELVIRGSNVMQGYWGDPEMSSKVYRQGPYPASRWLYSGDYFRQDDERYLYFLGRKDDMIKTRGERVSPREVENVVCEVDAVVEVAAVPVPDEILGQAIKIFVVAQDGCTEKEILRHCTSRLEAFMVPKYVEFIPALPKTGNGKVDRRKLLSAVMEQAE